MKQLGGFSNVFSEGLGDQMKNILLINPPVSIYKNKTAFVPLALLVMGTCLKQLRQQGAPIAWSVLDLDLLIKKGQLPDEESFFALAGQLILGACRS